MLTPHQETHSIWQQSDPPFFPCLSAPEAADVCVIGGGIAGLSAAYRLLERGLSVVVLDRGELGGETLRTSAHLTSALDRRWFRLRRLHGDRRAVAVAAAHQRAIADIESIALQEQIDCDFERVPAFLVADEDTLLREETACRTLGIQAEKAGAAPFLEGPALRFLDQARFHPGRYLAGLARAVQRKGGRIFARTEAVSAEGGRPARVPTNRGFEVVCENIVVATNDPFNDRFTMHTRIAPYRTTVVGLEITPEQDSRALVWDNADPYHYIRTVREPSGEVIALVGGGDHRVGQAGGDDPARQLLDWARDKLGLRGPLRYQWSGQILEPHDGLAFIGRNPGDHDNVLIATGFSGNGLTYGTLAGRLLADLIEGRANDTEEALSPRRVSLRSLGTYLSENFSTAAPYADWLTAGDVQAPEEIEPGEGAVVRNGAQKLAVYLDERGCPHFFSAVCPHLGGLVRWNGSEKTWDCPCHGSRFDKLGHVLNGPATEGLAAIVDTSIRDGDAVSA